MGARHARGNYRNPALWSAVWSREVVPAAEDLHNSVQADPVYHLLLKLARPRQGESILELGCGSGRLTLALAREFHLRPVLADFSPQAIALAKRNAGALGVRAECIICDTLDVAFASDQFDLVWSGGVFEHFIGADRGRVFAEATRVCRPGGRVVVIVPNAWNLLSRAGQLVSERLGRWPLGVEVPFSPGELRTHARQAGLVVEAMEGVDLLARYWALKLPGARPLLDLRSARAVTLQPTAAGRWFGHYIGFRGRRP